ncbi:MAG TPA: response regulator [Elusimicrobiales bacterium]|nr:response regulator [Elusimicrobiales bacterium]
MRILIVDDSEVTRTMMNDFLTAMGHVVVGEGEDGVEGVRLFSETSPDLVLMDMIMPRKNGMEALSEIKELSPQAKVVMVTAVQQEALSGQLLEKGAAAVLSKPFVYGELEAVLKKLA